jgi:hypothetical protein
MPWLELDPGSGHYKIGFRFAGRKFKKSLKTSDRRHAEAIAGGAEKTLLRLEQGLLDLPLGADLVSFVLSDGKRAEKLKAPEALDLQELADQYRAACSVGAMG